MPHASSMIEPLTLSLSPEERGRRRKRIALATQPSIVPRSSSLSLRERAGVRGHGHTSSWRPLAEQATS